MSKALGQAFLAHQVRQLESGAASRGKPHRRGGPRRPQDVVGRSNNQSIHTQQTPGGRLTTNHAIPAIIVLDTSIFVHSLDQIKKWLSGERPERLVVPLEVLNTLDLSKRGESPLSAQARAASRFLEEQIGANPKIVLQDDKAIGEWPVETDESTITVPQWVKNTLACALWEMAKGDQSVAISVVEAGALGGEEAKIADRLQGHVIYEWARCARVPVLSIAEGRRQAWYSQERKEGRKKSDSKPRAVYTRHYGSSTGPSTTPLVEKPVEHIFPQSGVRLLARGEMLAP